MMKKIRQFQKEIDAAFALAYSSLNARKSLFKRRHERFIAERGDWLDGMLHGANRKLFNGDKSAPSKCRHGVFFVAFFWIKNRERMHQKLEQKWGEMFND